MPTTAARSRHLRTFFLAMGMAVLMFLPFVILDKGMFIYYGDFNVQQIPFYKLAHEAVRSGNVFWSFYTDLGANFIGSYSFYLLFSPFFWLTLPFPTAWLPYLMAPLLVLKTACSALTAYLYLERFVKDRDYAMLGGILYAFSGWMMFNVFFNHFHDVAVFFPLLLLGVEKLVCENKKGFFALMVALNAMVNYWFFVGEVVFTVLYVFVRMTDPAWRMRLGTFIRLAFEAVLGVCLAGAALLPSVLALLGNPRTGTDSLLSGWNLWIYWQDQNQYAVLQSLFFPPELPARLNFFPDAGGAWSSRSAWLPLIGFSGALAYFMGRKNDWVKKLLGISLLMALIPGLNSLFILLNHSYYARWFYMPILLMCLASARALEDSAADTGNMMRALRWCFGITLAFIVMSGLTPQKKDGELLIGLAKTPFMLWAYAIVAMACLMLMTIFISRLRDHRRFKLLLGCGVSVISVAFGIFYMANGKNTMERSRFIANSAIGGREIVSLPDDGVSFSRMDAYDSLDNLGMFWHRPTIQAFQSIVPVSIMEFYPQVGVKRDVGSRPEADYYALRPLLSVRWLFIERGKEEQEPMPGYAFHSEQVGFNIYENNHFIPMGFGYDTYVDREQLEEIKEANRSNLMLRAIVLEDREAVERNADLLVNLDTAKPMNYSYDAMVGDTEDRIDQSCYEFTHDTRGFTARSNLDRDTLMFFSVPFEAGWTATVNGEPALIEKANIGFMAVRVPAGETLIRFDYMTPGLKVGALITGGALLILAVYLIFWRVRGEKTRKRELDVQRALFLGESVSLTWEEYLARYNDRQARRQALQSVLNEAGARHIDEKLDEEDRTFLFVPVEGEESGEPFPPQGKE